MAGVEGPCPTCSSLIKAPLAIPSVAPVSEAMPSYPAAPVSPAPVTAVATTPPEAAPTTTVETGSKIRLEPRVLPGGVRAASADPIAAKNSTEDPHLQRDPAIKRIKVDRRHNRFKMVRMVIPLVFLALAAGLVVMLLKHVMKADPDLPPLKTEPDPVAETEHAAADATPDTGEKSAKDPATKALIDPAAVTQTVVNRTVEQIISGDASVSSLTPEAIAKKQLLAFLDTESLDERANLADPAITGAELADTPLAKSYQGTKIISDPSEANQEKNYIDYPFQVGINLDGKKMYDVTFIVRTQGLYEPKILIDPLLDTIGGRISQYCSKPTDKPGSFKCVLEVLFGCNNSSVPNEDDKFTIKLKTGPSGMVIKEVFASKSSPIAKMLAEPESKLRWGSRARAAVTLGWNTTEDPGKPYVELLSVDSLSW
jgi:hypothetical protein